MVQHYEVTISALSQVSACPDMMLEPLMTRWMGQNNKHAIGLHLHGETILLIVLFPLHSQLRVDTDAKMVSGSYVRPRCFLDVEISNKPGMVYLYTRLFVYISNIH